MLLVSGNSGDLLEISFVPYGKKNDKYDPQRLFVVLYDQYDPNPNTMGDPGLKYSCTGSMVTDQRVVSH